MSDCYINGVPVDFKTADLNDPKIRQLSLYQYLSEMSKIEGKLEKGGGVVK